jgi:hypothetical protein
MLIIAGHPEGVERSLAMIRPERGVYPRDDLMGITTPESRMSLDI